MESENNTESNCSINVTDQNFASILNNTDCLVYSRAWTERFFYTLIIFLVFGLACNSYVIVSILCSPRKRSKVASILIINLAVSDFLAILSHFPSNSSTTLIKPWILGDVACKVLSYIQSVSVCSSIFTVAALSMERCLAIIRPVGDVRQGLKKSQVLLVITCNWAFSLTMYLPSLFTYAKTVDEMDYLPYCTSKWNSDALDKAYLIGGNLILCYILPLILMAMFNGRIGLSLGEITLARYRPRIPPVHRRRRIRIMTYIGFLALVIFACRLPFYYVSISIKFSGGYDLKEFIPLVQFVGSFMGYLNPILFMYLK